MRPFLARPSVLILAELESLDAGPSGRLLRIDQVRPFNATDEDPQLIEPVAR